jgi:hypothetical protein
MGNGGPAAQIAIDEEEIGASQHAIILAERA